MALDKDRDGSVTKIEMRRALPLLGFDAASADARETIDSIFDAIDLDSGGRISFRELHVALRTGGPHVAQPERLAGGHVT